jgi:hypothetical protein
MQRIVKEIYIQYLEGIRYTTTIILKVQSTRIIVEDLK